jgi:hypothetical protein
VLIGTKHNNGLMYGIKLKPIIGLTSTAMGLIGLPDTMIPQSEHTF